MKRVGLSPYGIIQAPCRNISLHPFPFPREAYTNPLLALSYDGIELFLVVTLTYASGGIYNFYCFYGIDIPTSDLIFDAWYDGIPYYGFVYGELWNFVLKPNVYAWD